MSASEGKVDGFSDWATTVSWRQDSRELKATLCRGSPYAYFIKTGDDIVISFTESPLVRHTSGGVVAVSINGHY